MKTWGSLSIVIKSRLVMVSRVAMRITAKIKHKRSLAEKCNFTFILQLALLCSPTK